ncbi:MAG: IS1634 family transposase [Actinomycetota bacterium]|nr:MAG: IS1634 family transposase [Actinomycetota bacterium]
MSKYRGGSRVRIVKRERVNGRPTTKLVKHIGTARNEEELEILKMIAETDRSRIEEASQLRFDFSNGVPRGLFTIGVHHYGSELVLGAIFDSLGISIGRLTPLLRLLTIARIIHPGSKRNTATWIKDSLGSGYSLDQIYRFLDAVYKNRSKIVSSMKEFVTTSYPSFMSYLLYDVTTIYFETDREDDDGIRKRGYSKDHHSDLPQVVLGLCVNELGMPLSFRLYPGHTYEGATLTDSVVEIRDQLGNRPVTVVADAGMLSAKNIALLKEQNLSFVISARIKNLDQSTTSEILSHDFTGSALFETRYNKDRLIVTYSENRARADRRRRERSVARLRRLIAENKALRRHPFLEFRLDGKVQLDDRAIERASKFDGLKGYLTNNLEMSPDDFIFHYSQLPMVEQSFRMTKSDLKIRPSFHFRTRRIESHVLLCMISLCVMRILEQKLKPYGYTYRAAIEIIDKTNSAIIGNTRKTHLIPPIYNEDFKAITKALDLN